MYNNILYGDLTKQPDDVFSAAKMANIHDTIVNRFPKQYDTEVGERGLKLSGKFFVFNEFILVKK